MCHAAFFKHPGYTFTSFLLSPPPSLPPLFWLFERAQTPSSFRRCVVETPVFFLVTFTRHEAPVIRPAFPPFHVSLPLTSCFISPPSGPFKGKGSVPSSHPRSRRPFFRLPFSAVVLPLFSPLMSSHPGWPLQSNAQNHPFPLP